MSALATQSAPQSRLFVSHGDRFPDSLDGYGEIAAYLGFSEPRAIRANAAAWGIPLHDNGYGDGEYEKPIAFPREIAEWICAGIEDQRGLPRGSVKRPDVTTEPVLRGAKSIGKSLHRSRRSVEGNMDLWVFRPAKSRELLSYDSVLHQGVMRRQ